MTDVKALEITDKLIEVYCKYSILLWILYEFHEPWFVDFVPKLFVMLAKPTYTSYLSYLYTKCHPKDSLILAIEKTEHQFELKSPTIYYMSGLA